MVGLEVLTTGWVGVLAIVILAGMANWVRHRRPLMKEPSAL